MPENHTSTGGQAVQRLPEALALPLVGHYPQAWQRLAGVHGCSYSRGMSGSSPQDGLAQVSEAIAKAAKLAGREPEEVTLVAVTKTHPAKAILPLLDAGHRHYGENRVQEAASKWPELRERYPEVALHLIGRLQSNKAGEAVALFDCIHSLDRPSLIASLAEAMNRQGRRPDCFVQVNVGEEAQKGGCSLAELPALLDQAREAELPVAGLMCIPPADVEAAPYFALLAKLARRHGLAGLSMGMSADYETAVAIGATHVRVGSALFGERA